MLKNKTIFYIVSLTWGIIMTLFGVLAAGVLSILGYRPEKWGYCWHFEVGKAWGGVNLGPIIITSAGAPDCVKNHEHGHSLQNCIYGPFMVVISLMSASRYWYREFKYNRKNLTPPTPYEAVWYEHDATQRGTAFINSLEGTI